MQVSFSESVYSRWPYYIGIIGMVVVAITTWTGNPIIEDNAIVWAIAVGHVLLLALLTLFLHDPFERHAAGQRIQTAGYLHTLIAIVLVLVSFQNISVGYSSLFPLFGMALVTSILGWFLGGEISRHGRTGDAGTDSVAELKEFHGFLTKLHKDYEQALSDSVKTIESTTAAHEQLMTRQREQAQQLVTSIGGMVQTVKTSADGLASAKEKLDSVELRETVVALNKVLTAFQTTLGQSDKLVDSMLAKLNKEYERSRA